MGGSKSKRRGTHDVLKYDNDLIMSREEQYEWLMFLIKASKKEIIKHMKRDPRKATAVMRFDFFGSCDCSYYAECCKGKNGSKDLLLLQRCVRYGLCPHILLLRHGYSEDNPLFYTEELFEPLYSITDLDTMERSTPTYSGLYWIHVAIITEKFDAVVAPFSFVNFTFNRTLDLKLNPLHLALLHDVLPLIKQLIRCNIDFVDHSIKLKKEVWTFPVSAEISITEFLVLQNIVSAIQLILPLFRISPWKRLAGIYNALIISIEKNKPGRKEGTYMEKSVQANNIDCMNVLCKYICLNACILRNCLERAIDEENLDVCNILVTNMQKSSTIVNCGHSILFRAILGRNSKIMSLLFQNKCFTVSNSDINDLLKWAEILKLPEIYDMLIADGCKKEQTDQSGCPIRTVIQCSVNTLINVKILVEESGFDPNGEYIVRDTCQIKLPPVYHALLRNQLEVVEYLVLHGASLKLAEQTQHRLIRGELITEQSANYDLRRKFILILVKTNGQFLVHVSKTVLFNMIDTNVVLFDILYKLSHTIPRSLMQDLEEYWLNCDDTKPTLSSEDERINRLNTSSGRNAVIETILYKPKTLQMACRNTFRRHCGLKFSTMITSLEETVPRKIISFLKFDEVIDKISEIVI